MPVNSDGTTCVLDASGNLKSSALTDACFGGSARRKQFISEFKAANPRTIALDGGSELYVYEFRVQLLHAIKTP